MIDAVLALNAGSSSIKFALFEANDALSRIAHGAVTGIDTTPHFEAFDHEGRKVADRQGVPHEAGSEDDEVALLLRWCGSHLAGARLAAVGHRIVHGGRDFVAPVRLTGDVLAALERLTPLAPLHQPHNLAPIRTIAASHPGLAQVGCFDTAFHHEMPAVARHFALPAHYFDEGVRRYGFHGLSYEFIARRLAEIDPAAGRVVVAHIGNGASACAMRDSKSHDTSMGFSVLDGMMMGTRPGALDPGAVLYMAQHEGLSPAAISDILYHRSGLLGISGEASDMRALLESGRPAARLAVDLFCYRAAREIAALTVAIGGLDTLVFTAGIGEHTPAVRRAICDRLAHFGIEIDEAANRQALGLISTAGSRVAVRMIPTDEEAVIARHTIEVLSTPV